METMQQEFLAQRAWREHLINCGGDTEYGTWIKLEEFMFYRSFAKIIERNGDLIRVKLINEEDV